MIVLTVLSYNSAPTDGLSASFDEMGGTIGRADNNQLVLPDPERTISRIHARVVFRANGGYAIVDNGSNPISVNGILLGSGRESPLVPGDQVQIGGYLLKVSAGNTAAASDPFADLFGDAAGGLADPPTTVRPVSTAFAPAPAARTVAPPPAPRPPPPAPPPAWPAPPAASAAPGGIPDDWDPFAPDPTAGGAQPHAKSLPPAGPGLGDLQLGPQRHDSLDDLFDLGPQGSGSDPFANVAAPLAPNTAGHDDPLQSLQQTPRATTRTAADLGSELQTPMPLPPKAAPAVPPATVAATPAAKAAPAAPASPAAPGLPAGAVFSWDEPGREGRVVTMPGVRRATDAAAAPAAAPAAPAAAGSDRRAPAAAPAVAHAPAAGEAALLAAFLEGLSAPSIHLESLNPAVMRQIGVLLREATRGTVELLVARAALKREMRAEVTMIAARENNPLKFSPSAEVALQHLLGPPSPGFMHGTVALRDAYDDLRAHQLGVMAGMRAALEGVLQRFDPQQLEGKLTAKSTISSLIPSMRKARLWELFQELFSQLSSEAQDDFEELFGKAFLRAYQAQLDRLRAEPAAK